MSSLAWKTGFALVTLGLFLEGWDSSSSSRFCEATLLRGEANDAFAATTTTEVEISSFRRRMTGLCEEGCTTYEDCDAGLNCYNGTNWDVHPQGSCEGLGKKKNFCYEPLESEVVFIAQDMNPNQKLKECQADCDNDWECKYGLVCQQREGDEEVHGCSGEAIPEMDYCVYPPKKKQLVLYGNGKSPPSRFPLKECQGDCDSDDDCRDLLVCMQRDANEKVPGCKGWGATEADYCYDAGHSHAPSLSPTEPTTPPPTWAPRRKKCKPGCSDYEGCKWGLNCYDHSSGDPIPTGCNNGVAATGENFCYVPEESELVLAGDDGFPKSAFPLQECQGDCDSDWDCDWGLVCQERLADEPVRAPCYGSPVTTRDYCVKPLEGELVLMGNQGSGQDPGASGKAAVNPLGLAVCEGDCDSDSDCDGLLACFQRGESNALEAVPGCVGVGAEEADYCYDRGDTHEPSMSPSSTPTTSPPSSQPSSLPSASPTGSTYPSASPSIPPSDSPTTSPSMPPTDAPTTSPSEPPTTSPTGSPSEGPTSSPTEFEPIGHCEPGCESDLDCISNHVCLRINKNNKKDCKLRDLKRQKVCIEADKFQLSFGQYKKLNICRGDCLQPGNSCKGKNLKCFKKKWNNDLPPNSKCYGKAINGVGYCIR